MANNFRSKSPVRTFAKKYTDYTNYKQHLKTDFSNRCGYTDCPDHWFGGVVSFHIDHFKPWKKYPGEPNLKTDYANLVYCCSYVNILKSDDIGHYIDPCDVDFNDHFERDADGTILAKTGSVPANYMYKKMKLYLLRYQIIWKLADIFEKMEKMKELIEKEVDDNLRKDLKVLLADLAGLMLDQMKYLRANQ